MGEQAEKETEAKKSTGVMGLLVWLGLILVLYVLSLGPVTGMSDKEMIPKDWNGLIFDGFYLPLEWAYERTPLHKPLGMYLHLWSDQFDKNGEFRPFF